MVTLPSRLGPPGSSRDRRARRRMRDGHPGRRGSLRQAGERHAECWGQGGWERCIDVGPWRMAGWVGGGVTGLRPKCTNQNGWCARFGQSGLLPRVLDLFGSVPAQGRGFMCRTTALRNSLNQSVAVSECCTALPAEAGSTQNVAGLHESSGPPIGNEAAPRMCEQH